MIGSPPKKATNITQTCASRCIKCTFKIDNYLWHGFICCWQLEGRRACVSNTVTNLSTMFPYYKCSKCVVRHLGKATNITQKCVSSSLWKLISTCDMGLFVVGHSKDGEHVYQTVLPTWILLFFPFCKCSKWVVRHLGRPPTSPRNVIIWFLWKQILLRWG